jgi:capsular polysaccharide export protein
MRSFLFLQGPISPFLRRVGEGLRAHGHAVLRVNLCIGDWLFWRGDGVVNFQDREAAWPDFVARLMQRHAVTDLVLLGEQRPYHKAAIAEAKRLGIAVTVTDFGYLRPDWIVLERDGMNAESHFPRDPDMVRRLARGLCEPAAGPVFEDRLLNQAFWDVSFHLANLLPWPFPHFRSFQRYPVIPAYLGTAWRLWRSDANGQRALRILAAIPPAAPMFVFAMQMETDFSVRAYSRFDGMEDALALAIASFARGAPGDAHLLTKLHPLDPGLKRWERRIARMAAAAGVGGRVHFLDGGPLDEIIARAAGLVTVNSTAAIRAIQLGTPCRPLGAALWDVPGLAHQGPLDGFWAAPPRPDPDLARAWLTAIAHHLHLRGVYYAEPGLSAAVAAAVERLSAGRIGPFIPAGS